MAQLRAFKLGYSTILVSNDEFGDGYSNGLLSYTDQEHPLTVEEIRNVIVESLTDSVQTENWNIGYIAGAIRSFHEGAYQRRDEPDAPLVQLGLLTLQLNRWRFRDGFYNGQSDYRMKQAEQTTPSILTARELLSYVAHHDPDTQRFYFGEDELSALEDMLGQFTGYLCAALCMQPAPQCMHEPAKSVI